MVSDDTCALSTLKDHCEIWWQVQETARLQKRVEEMINEERGGQE